MKNQRNKSVLVIDTPKNCMVCPCYEDKKVVCKVYNIEVSGNRIPVWCPLSLLPERKDLTEYTDNPTIENILAYQFTQGYNTCLDEIQGETNE